MSKQSRSRIVESSVGVIVLRRRLLTLKRMGLPALWARWPLLTIAAVLLCTGTVLAFSIDDVIVLPSGTITPDDPVTLEVHITTPSSSAFLYRPTEIVVVGGEISIEIFPDSGALGALDYIVEAVSLGTFQPGTYHYTVDLTPKLIGGWGTRTVSGSFSVAGEPAIPTTSLWGTIVMLLLLVAAGTIMLRRCEAPKSC